MRVLRRSPDGVGRLVPVDLMVIGFLSRGLKLSLFFEVLVFVASSLRLREMELSIVGWKDTHGLAFLMIDLVRLLMEVSSVVGVGVGVGVGLDMLVLLFRFSSSEE